MNRNSLLAHIKKSIRNFTKKKKIQYKCSTFQDSKLAHTAYMHAMNHGCNIDDYASNTALNIKIKMLIKQKQNYILSTED
jgi:hypothetical protein